MLYVKWAKVNDFNLIRQNLLKKSFVDNAMKGSKKIVKVFVLARILYGSILVSSQFHSPSILSFSLALLFKEVPSVLFENVYAEKKTKNEWMKSMKKY